MISSGHRVRDAHDLLGVLAGGRCTVRLVVIDWEGMCTLGREHALANFAAEFSSQVRRLE